MIGYDIINHEDNAMRKTCSKKVSLSIEENEAALILTEKQVKVVFPKTKEGEEIPDHIMVVTALAMLLNDGSEPLAMLLHEKLKEMEKQTYPTLAGVYMQ